LLKNIFQIIPVPNEAPQVSYALGDHPFILQFKYLSSPDFVINQTRRTEQATKYTRFLNVISKSRVFKSPRYNTNFWALKTADLDNWSSEWTQEGYILKNFENEVKNFSEPGDLIKLTASDIYYNRGHVRSTSDFELPDDVEIMLDKIFSLDLEKYKKFEIACTWFSQNQYLWPHSSSAAFIAIISSLESLMDKSGEKCKCCGQPKYSITKKFSKFLKDYVPDIDKMPYEENLIYKTRSDLAHGADLFLSDLEPWGFFSGNQKINQDSLQRNTYQIVATALLNWLKKN